jgi:hypothetical protein
MSATATRSRTADSPKEARAVERGPAESLSQTAPSGDISNLAYTLWERRGSPIGSAEVDWLGAERQLSQSSEK